MKRSVVVEAPFRRNLDKALRGSRHDVVKGQVLEYVAGLEMNVKDTTVSVECLSQHLSIYSPLCTLFSFDHGGTLKTGNHSFVSKARHNCNGETHQVK